MEKIEIHNFKFNNISHKIVPFVSYVEKYVKVGQATDDNGASALNSGYQRLERHTHNT